MRQIAIRWFDFRENGRSHCIIEDGVKFLKKTVKQGVLLLDRIDHFALILIKSPQVKSLMPFIWTRAQQRALTPL